MMEGSRRRRALRFASYVYCEVADVSGFVCGFDGGGC